MEIATRKTISIKSSHKNCGMWSIPSKIDELERQFLREVKAILQSYASTPTTSYDDTYRLNCATMRHLTTCIDTHFKELQATVRFPAQSRQMFDRLVGKMTEQLRNEGLMVLKFEEAMQHFMHPKESLPKIAMATP